jgi:hypothetical protein
MDLTKNQIDLMKHTVSERSRNWFGTNYRTPDSAEFEKLVEHGLATKEEPPAWMGDDVIYRLTSAGKKAIAAEPLGSP